MATNNERSFTDILQDIVGNIQGIIRSEILLAKSELREQARTGLAAGKSLGVGIVISFFGATFLLLGIASVLALFLPQWAALMIMAIVLLIIGLTLVRVSQKRLQEVHLTPDRAMESIKENVRWAKQQTK